jgi:hypothetical protein
MHTKLYRSIEYVQKLLYVKCKMYSEQNVLDISTRQFFSLNKSSFCNFVAHIVVQVCILYQWWIVGHFLSRRTNHVSNIVVFLLLPFLARCARLTVYWISPGSNIFLFIRSLLSLSCSLTRKHTRHNGFVESQCTEIFLSLISEKCNCIIMNDTDWVIRILWSIET